MRESNIGLCLCSYLNVLLLGFNSDKEKVRLQNRMAYGQDCVPSVPAKPKPSDTNDEDIDRFEEGVYLDMVNCQ